MSVHYTLQKLNIHRQIAQLQRQINELQKQLEEHKPFSLPKYVWDYIENVNAFREPNKDGYLIAKFVKAGLEKQQISKSDINYLLYRWFPENGFTVEMYESEPGREVIMVKWKA